MPHLPLGHLESALVPANLQQLHQPLLIWRLASHLTHNVTHKLDALGLALQQGEAKQKEQGEVSGRRGRDGKLARLAGGRCRRSNLLSVSVLEAWQK
jgi:hypothetical protein